MSMTNIEIVDSLRSLYPLKDFEEKAVMEVVEELRELKERSDTMNTKDNLKYIEKSYAIVATLSMALFFGLDGLLKIFM